MRRSLVWTGFAIGLTLGVAAQGQQPWQHLQMPTAATVLSHWNDAPPEYGPEPYYGFSGAMDLTAIRRDLDQLKSLGFEAVTIQGGRGLPYPYLSEGYFKLFRTFVEEAKKRDMRVWIVDDAGYPSGFAGGKFTQEKPELRMQALEIGKRIPAAAGQRIQQAVTPETVAATAVNLQDGSTRNIPIANGAIDWTAPAGQWEVRTIEHQFRTSPTRSDTNPRNVKDTEQSLEDYLNPKATMQYLAFTHEQYKRTVGDEFGKTIMGFRGDEPDYSIRGLPWTPALFDRFQTIKGYDVRPYLASFFGKALTPEEQRAKADYWDVFSMMFRDGFFKVQGDWCAANHLEYQVHLNHEEMEMALARSEGDFFRDMRYVQVPGIDAIWHQIDPDTVSDYPRLASSVSHVYGKPRAFTESFAAYRPLPDVKGARYILNEQFVRGINLVEAMYFPSTSKGPRPAPSFMGQPGFPELMHYTRRMSYLMSMGRPTASVALFLPTSSFWMGDAASDRAFVSTERLLSEHQIDFDIVDENALAKELKPGKGTLETLSGNTYRTVILPHAAVLSEEALARLKSFAAGGGKVLFLETTPKLISGHTYLHARAATKADFAWATVVDDAELPATPTPPAQPPAEAPGPMVVPPAILSAVEGAVVSPDLKMDEPDPALKMMKRELKDASVFLFFNEGAQASEHTVTLLTRHRRAEVWDAETGETHPLEAKREAGGLAMRLSLAPYATEVVVLR